MVILMVNLLGSKGSHRESIFARKYWVGVPSMRYIGSSDPVKVVTLVIIYWTRDLPESM